MNSTSPPEPPQPPGTPGNCKKISIQSMFFIIVGWGGESFVTPPTGKSCFVFVFALRACVRDATRDQGVSRHVFVPPPAAPPPAAASRYCKTAAKSLFGEKVI